MYKKRREVPVHLQPHPPFPSFAWVMTAQANPPSPAYAYGYTRSVRARARAKSNKPAYPPARRTLPPGLHQHPASQPQFTTRPPPPPPTRTGAAAVLTAEGSSEKFMETVDYRCHDPPSRPCVPWLEGYRLPRRGAGAQRHVPHEDGEEGVIPLASSIAEPPQPPQPPPTVSTSARLAKWRFSGSASDSDDALPRKKRSRRTRARTRARTSVDVKISRLDIVLGALRRACRLSAKEEPGKPS